MEFLNKLSSFLSEKKETFQLPNLEEQIWSLEQAGGFAGKIDQMFMVILWISIIGFFATIIPMIYFSVKHRRSKSNQNKTPYIEGNTPMELGVSFGLLIIVMIFFAWGLRWENKLATKQDDAIVIDVVASQWKWKFIYSNGHSEFRTLVVPEKSNIRLKMIAEQNDVIHSFFVPDFRNKKDVVPGLYTYFNFTSGKAGDKHTVYCAEYCGMQHSTMQAEIQVLSKEDYNKWQQNWKAQQAKEKSGIAQVSPIEQGKKLFTTHNCNTCHSIEGKSIVGPALNGLYGRSETLTDGTQIKADDNYLRESIVNPKAKVVKGYAPSMPAYASTLKEDELNALLAYIKSLK